MPTFYTPPGYSGTAELTASNGLSVIAAARWNFSQAGYNDQATFGVSMGWPDKAQGVYYYGTDDVPQPMYSGELHLSATDWPIAVVGNTLTSYYDPETGITYPATKCRITVTGHWDIVRQVNSNSFNSFGVLYNGLTNTNQGSRSMSPYLLNYTAPTVVYVIQGSSVQGGAQNTFSGQEFWCKITEYVSSDNSNKEFQSNSIVRPVWSYAYAKSWQI